MMAESEMLSSEFLHLALSIVIWLGYITLGVFLTGLTLATLVTYGPLLRAYSVSYRRGKRLPPGTLGWPFWGESHDYVKFHLDSKNPDAWFDAKRKKYGNVFKTHILGNPTIVLLGVAGNKFVLQNDRSHFENSWPKSARQILGVNCMAITTGSQHTKLRTAMAHFAGPEAIRTQLGHLESLCIQHLDKYWEGMDEIKVFDCMAIFSFSVAADVFMNFSSDFMKEQYKALLPFIAAGLLSLPLDLPWTNFGRGYKASKAARRILHSEIERKKKIIESGQSKASPSDPGAAKDFIELLLVSEGHGSEWGKATDIEIADNMILLLIASYDTSASALTVIIQKLASHPAVLAKLRQECKKVAENKRAGEGLTMAEVKSMKYMSQVINESLRICPPIPGVFKKARHDVEYEGFTIPKGWTVHISTRSAMMKEEYFPNPHEFNPDRFAGSRPDPFSFIPFSQGVRLCPGMDFARLEMHLLLYHIMLRYNFELVNSDEKYNMFWFPIPQEGLPVRITSVEK